MSRKPTASKKIKRLQLELKSVCGCTDLEKDPRKNKLSTSPSHHQDVFFTLHGKGNMESGVCEEISQLGSPLKSPI